MKSLEEIILNSIVGSVVKNYHGEKRVVTAASVGNNHTGFNGSYVFTLELQLKDDYPIEIGLDDQVFVSLPTSSKPDSACSHPHCYVTTDGAFCTKCQQVIPAERA